jgi:hypothetical protein
MEVTSKMEEEEKATVVFTTPRDLGYIRYEKGRFVKCGDK